MAQLSENEWEDLVEGDWAHWYRLTPAERWKISHEVLWPNFLGRTCVLTSFTAPPIP
jgi:hypothetical protein